MFRPIYTALAREKIQSMADAIGVLPCRRCGRKGPECARHSKSCRQLYLDEAKVVHQQFIAPLEEEIAALKERLFKAERAASKTGGAA